MKKKKKLNYDYMFRARSDLKFIKYDEYFCCDSCGYRLNRLKMLKKTLFKKKGDEYRIICPDCKFINKRHRGDLGDKLRKEWEERERNINSM